MTYPSNVEKPGSGRLNWLASSEANVR